MSRLPCSPRMIARAHHTSCSVTPPGRSALSLSCEMSCSTMSATPLQSHRQQRVHEMPAASWLNSEILRAYALEDRRAMSHTRFFLLAAALGGVLGSLAQYPAATSGGNHSKRTRAATTAGALDRVAAWEAHVEQRNRAAHVLPTKRANPMPTPPSTARGSPSTRRTYPTSWITRLTSTKGSSWSSMTAQAQRVRPSSMTPPSTKSRTKWPTTGTTRTSSTTRSNLLSQEPGDSSMKRTSRRGKTQQHAPNHYYEDQGDEASWMAVSNTNPPTRGTTRMGSHTTTTTSPPPPPPPQLQEADTPLPPPLQPDMLLNMGYPQGTTWVLEEGVWQPIFPGEAQGPGGAIIVDPLQQYHSGWSIFADEGQEGAGSASSSQAPPQQQSAAAGPGGPRGGNQYHQQHQQQQPYLPRQAVARGAAPAATSQWNTGWSPAHQAPPQQAQPQPQQGRGYVVPAPGTWGYAATAAPSNGPWRPRYAPVYDPYTDPWHEDEEDDPPLPTGSTHTSHQTWQWGAAGGQPQPQAQHEHRHSQQGRGVQIQGGHVQDQQPSHSSGQPMAGGPTQITALTWEQQQALIQGSATYQANRLSAIQAQQAKPPHMLPHQQPGPGGATPTSQPTQHYQQQTSGSQQGTGPQQGQAPQQQPRLIPEELQKVREHKQKQAQAVPAQAEAPNRRWGNTADNPQTQQPDAEMQWGHSPQQSPDCQQQTGGTQQHTPDDQERDDMQAPELEEVCGPQGGQDQDDQCQGGASQRNYHEGQGDQRRGNKATKSEIRAEFRKRGLRKPDHYTWNQVAHWVDMVPFETAEEDGSQPSPTQQGDAGGGKEATRHRERYEARERGDLRQERRAEDQVPRHREDTTANVGDKAAAEHRERYQARQQGDYRREQPTGAQQQRDAGRTQQRKGHGSHQADSARGQPGTEVKPVTTRGGVAWWKGENLQSIHDRDGVFNHFTYSWGAYSPPLTWPPELPLSGSMHLHLRYLAHGLWVGEVLARGSELTPPYGRVPDRGFRPVPLYTHANICSLGTPEQWHGCWGT